MQKDLSKSILERIKEQHIKPDSKIKVSLKKTAVWLFVAFSIFVGGLSFGLILFVLSDTEWALYAYFNNNFWSFLLGALPYFWFITLLGFSALFYLNFTKTEKGYKHNPIIIVLGGLLISMALGAVIFASGISKKTENVLTEHLPMYRNMHFNKHARWMNPEGGFLAGEILKINNEDNFQIKDFNSGQWQVFVKNAHNPHNLDFKEGLRVKMMGVRLPEHQFEARLIMPWHEEFILFPPSKSSERNF